MSLYVRQSAWLHASPERPKGDKSETPIPSRLEKLRRARDDEDYQPEMPPLEVGGYLAGFLFEIGPTMPAGMGPAMISHQEIESWQTLAGITLKPWEVKTLRRLSSEYIRELREAEKPDRPAPWQPVDYVPDLGGVAEQMRNAMKKRANL